MQKNHNYFLVAMFCGIVAFSVSLALKISAQTVDSLTSNTSVPVDKTNTITTAPVMDTKTKTTTTTPASNTSVSVDKTNTTTTAPVTDTKTEATTITPVKIPATTTAIISTSADNTSERDSDVEKDLTPEFSFLNLREGVVMKGMVDIEGKVANAKTVEFYLIPFGSNILKYLGSAKNTNENAWHYSFNSFNFPNGSFYIKAKIRNTYGTYESSRKSIAISNLEKTAISITTPVATESPKDSIEANYSSTQSEKTVVKGSEETPNYNGNTSDEWQSRYFGSNKCVQKDICGGLADPDMDGLNNSDEYRYKTNPKNPDSDQDGFLDGDEIRNGFNPLKSSPGDKSDKIVFENPKESGEIKADTYRVEKVEMIKNEKGENHLKLSGKAIPNSFVTIYIYSDPIILTVKTDNDGNWSYELDKDLGDGEHHAYVAVTDNSGKITNKSNPIAFVKTAEAVEIVTPAEAFASERAASPTETRSKKDLIFFIAIILSELAIALAALGLFRHHTWKKEDGIIKN